MLLVGYVCVAGLVFLAAALALAAGFIDEARRGLRAQARPAPQAVDGRLAAVGRRAPWPPSRCAA